MEVFISGFHGEADHAKQVPHDANDAKDQL
jgi:hypothetical protein